MKEHTIELRVGSRHITGRESVDSTVNIDARGGDLVNVFEEVIRQMPDAVFYAFEVAMRNVNRGALP